MSRCRALVAVLSLALMLPSAAFAQGAGDEQYQDPFGDEQAQQQPRAAQDDGEDGLSDAPPGGADEPATPPADEPADEPAEDPAADETTALPNTGSDPRILAFIGVLFLLVGVGLRLRTVDPDAY
jgi:LPXTG-motif cell wall-anchored protein